MGVLIAVEGIDGAGKATLIAAVAEQLRTAGNHVATLGFPRYGQSVHADLAAEALRGCHGDVAASVSAMALLFALDRLEARDQVNALCAAHDVVLLDRYVASNVAYSCARAREPVTGEIGRWIEELEFHRFAVPQPTLHVLLELPADVAGARARRRAEFDATRALDAYERDDGLQKCTAEVYREMAELRWHGPWWIHRTEDDPAALVSRLSEIRAREMTT